MHLPVLAEAVVDCLRLKPGSVVLDCTLGFGGHTALLLAAGARVTGVDRDPEARRLATERLAHHGEALDVRPGTFADAVEECAAQGITFDGVLADLGVSSMQLDDDNRGFSIRSDAAADMRMGDGCPASALELIRDLDENALADVLFRYGEERLSRRIARALKRAQAEGTLSSGASIAEVVRRVVPGHHQRHPALRTFQGLRIAVNDELGQLERLLAALPTVVRPGGIAAVISFHSLEDRLVKHAWRDQQTAGTWSEGVRKPIVANDAEQAANPRAHSAKLRWVRRAQPVSAASTPARRPPPPPIHL